MNGLWPLAPGARGKSLEDSKGMAWPFINDIEATRYVVVVQVEKVASHRPEKGVNVYLFIYLYLHIYVYSCKVGIMPEGTRPRLSRKYELLYAPSRY